jgi:hypothetical protein
MPRTLLLLVFIVIHAQTAFTQTIPNAGFEDWMDGNPVGWWTNNIPGLIVPIVETSIAHDGSSAVLGTVVEYSGNGFTPIMGAGLNGAGFPINSRPEALHGWYMFQSDSGDNFSATVALVKNRQAVGAGLFYDPTVRTVYTEFVVNITYISPEIPDTANILFLIANSPEVHIGSTFTLDDLSFGMATGVEDTPLPEGSFALEQNYPNPFNPTTRIPFEIGEEGHVTLRVYNLLGQELATLVDERMPPGRYRAEFDASVLPAGMYLYRLQTDGHTATRKMMLVK